MTQKAHKSKLKCTLTVHFHEHYVYTKYLHLPQASQDKSVSFKINFYEAITKKSYL